MGRIVSDEIQFAAKASEGGNWYDRSGRQVEMVPSADGKSMVRPDVRHARKLGLLPGVTGITGCAAKPQLTEWMVMQGIMASMTLPRRPHEPEAEFIKRVVEDSQAQAKAARDRGTAIHGGVQRHFEGKPVGEEFQPYVDGVVAKLNEAFGADTEWSSEQSFACRLGFGSKIDLRATNRRIIVDLKGKEFTAMPSGRQKFHYDEHAQQLAAYDQAMRMQDEGPPHVCANLFISREVPGLTHLHIWEGAEELNRGWAMFKGLLSYWQARHKYQSGWTP